MSAAKKLLSVLVAVTVAACASSATSTESSTPAATPTPAADPPAQAETPAPAAEAATYFTAAQANSGRDTFRSLCTECHYSSEFSDAQFKFKWSRRSAENLYDLIFTQMPESAPGSLSPDEAVSLVTYILRMNGFEEGTTELAADPGLLSAISLSSIRN